MTDTTTHDFALARAERDAWQTTCEELHHTIARLTVEAETYRKAGRGLVAQVEQLRGDLQWSRSRVKCAGNSDDPCGWRGYGAAVVEWEDNGETPRCPNCEEGCVEIDHAAEDHPESVGNEAAELRAIRDLVAPGNPQGTVVDAVRTTLHALGLVRADRDRADAEIAKLRAEVAELRARPALTVEAAVAAAREADWSSAERHDAETVVEAILAALGPVTLPSPDRAEELCRKYHNRIAIATAESRIASIGAEIDRTLGEHAGGRISALEAARDRIATLEAELARAIAAVRPDLAQFFKATEE